MTYAINDQVVVGLDKLPPEGVLTAKGSNRDYDRLFPQRKVGIKASFMKVKDIIEVANDPNFVLYALESALGITILVNKTAVLGLASDIERKNEVAELEPDQLILIKNIEIFGDNVQMGIVKQAMSNTVRVVSLGYHCLPDGAHQIRQITIQTMDKKFSCSIELPKGLRSAIKRGDLEVII